MDDLGQGVGQGIGDLGCLLPALMSLATLAFAAVLLA